MDVTVIFIRTSVSRFFFGRGTLQDMYREWPTSRFAAVYSLNPENQTPTL